MRQTNAPSTAAAGAQALRPPRIIKAPMPTSACMGRVCTSKTADTTARRVPLRSFAQQARGKAGLEQAHEHEP